VLRSPTFCITWRSVKLGSRYLKASNSFARRSRWRCQPGFLANDLPTRSLGAPAFCLSVPFLQCEPSPSPQPKQLKIFEGCERMFDAGQSARGCIIEYQESSNSAAVFAT